MLKPIFNEVADLKACNFIKKLQRRSFPVNTAKLFKIPILKNICERMLLDTGVTINR